MTSTFLTARMGFAVSGCGAGAAGGMRNLCSGVSRPSGSGTVIRRAWEPGCQTRRAPEGLTPPPLALLRAVARGDLLLRGVVGRDLLHQRLGHLLVGGVPVGDDLPGLAVPLHDAPVARALVVGTGDLDRAQHAVEAQLLDA